MTAADPLAALEALLKEENAALAAMRLGRAADLLPRKQQLAQAIEGLAAADIPADTLRRLQRLAEENRAALARAMRVQRRMLEMLADAARQAQARPAYASRPRRMPAAAPALMLGRA
jgi:hypothetical protein